MGSENWFLVWDIGKESVIIGLVWLVLEEPHVLQRILVIDWKGLDIDGNLGLYFGSISFFFLRVPFQVIWIWCGARLLLTTGIFGESPIPRY